MIKKLVVAYCAILLAASVVLTGSIALDAASIIKLPRPAFAGLVATPLAPNPGGTAQPWWYSQSIAGLRFIGGGIVTCAAQFPEIQLFNPGASGKTIVVDQLDFVINTATSFELRQHATALGTALTQGNLLMGGSAPVGLTKSACPAARDGTSLNGGGWAPASAATLQHMNLGITIPQSNGVLITTTATNSSALQVTYIWQEQ